MPVAPVWFWMSQKTCPRGHRHPDTILNGTSCLVVDLNENIVELHYLHTNSAIQFWVFCEWLDWAIRCLLPPSSWCNCRLDTEMSFDSQMSLNTSRLQTCGNEWNTPFFPMSFSHAVLMVRNYRPYWVGKYLHNQSKDLSNVRLWPFPNQVVSQGRNQLDSPKDDPTIRPSKNPRRMCPWAWSNCARVSNSLERCNPGGWWLVDGHPPPEKMMGILYNGYTHYKSNINPILFGLVI